MLLVGIKNDAATLEYLIPFLKKLNLELSYDPAIPLLDIYSPKLKIDI